MLNETLSVRPHIDCVRSIERWRAPLPIAAGSQVVPKAFFTTMTFDEWGVVATAILSDRKVAGTIVVSSDCAYRLLVILHIRLDRNRPGCVRG
ncbi:hypothetical protein [Burkholderia ambifaria]